jgi:hypothetical protein
VAYDSANNRAYDGLLEDRVKFQTIALIAAVLATAASQTGYQCHDQYERDQPFHFIFHLFFSRAPISEINPIIRFHAK